MWGSHQVSRILFFRCPLWRTDWQASRILFFRCPLWRTKWQASRIQFFRCPLWRTDRQASRIQFFGGPAWRSWQAAVLFQLFSHGGNSGCFPWGKPAVTVVLSNLLCMLGVLVFHNPPNTYTGSLTCTPMLMHVVAHGGIWTP